VSGATVKLAALEPPPPGAGLTTVTATLPAEARSAAPMLALSWLLLTNAVARLLPPHCTIELDKKLEPFTVRVKGSAPAGALLGEMEPIVGVGFGVGVGAGVGVGVGPGVAPDPEPQPAPPAQNADINNPARMLTARFFVLNIGTPHEPWFVNRLSRVAPLRIHSNSFVFVYLRLVRRSGEISQDGSRALQASCLAAFAIAVQPIA